MTPPLLSGIFALGRGSWIKSNSMTKGMGDHLGNQSVLAEPSDCSATLSQDSQFHLLKRVSAEPPDDSAVLRLDFPIQPAERVLNFDCMSESDLTVEEKSLKQSLESGLMFFAKPAPLGIPGADGSVQDSAQPGVVKPPVANVQMLLWSHLDTIAGEVPPGTTVQARDFENVFHEKADVLRQAGLVSIKRQMGKSGDHIVLEFNDQKSTPTKDASFIHAKIVEFDFKRVGTLSVLDNIKGLSVEKVLTATIEKVTLSHDQNDVTTLIGKGSWGITRWPRYHGEKTVIVGADGKRLDKN
jgi:hypothetical protein